MSQVKFIGKSQMKFITKSQVKFICICDPLREKGDFRTKYIYELHSKIVEYALPRGLSV